MITLKNSELTAQISEQGAELKSVLRGGREYIWNADPRFWSRSAPIMFPICGGLKNGRYELDGVSYEMPKHGFAKQCSFEVAEQTETRAALVLRDNDETRRMYPYAFEFKVVFELEGDSLRITYDIENRNSRIMYCSVGAHEAYACPEGIEDYDIVFPENETLYAYALNGELLTDYTKLILDNARVLPLKDEYFYLDALVFRGLKSRSAELVCRSNGRRVRVDFEGFDYFLLWHKFGAPFICIEPWCGIQDVAGTPYGIEQKEGINAIPVGERLVKTHTLTFAE